MLEDYFASLEQTEKMRVGCLGRFLDAFSDQLLAQGYYPANGQMKLRCAAAFDAWLRRAGTPLSKVDDDTGRRFLQARRRNGRLCCGDGRTIRDLLSHLRRCSAIPQVPTKVDRTATARVTRAFEVYLRDERGAVASTISTYLGIVRGFLRERFGLRRVVLGDLRPMDVARWISRHSRGRTGTNGKWRLPALRCFFRFLRVIGETRSDLSSSIFAPAKWRLAGLPRSIAPDQVARVLRSCDASTAAGARDYAAILLLTRLGLRAHEVVALRLDDVRWTEGQIVVHGKGPREDRLPLPPDVGRALVRYLRRGRPTTTAVREVFLCARPPHRKLKGSSTLCSVVRRAFERAGVNVPIGACHVLRHTLATSMLRAGSSLPEIGRVLRHRSPETTAIYAKVDFDSLRPIAPAWPRAGR